MRKTEYPLETCEKCGNTTFVEKGTAEITQLVQYRRIGPITTEVVILSQEIPHLECPDRRCSKCGKVSG